MSDIHERRRNLLDVSRANSRPAQLPSIPPAATDDPATNRSLNAMREWIEVRSGTRGNDFERAITKRDLSDLGLIGAEDGQTVTLGAGGASSAGVAVNAVVVKLNGGLYAGVLVDDFAKRIYESPTFKTLIKRLDDPTRFDSYPDEIRAALDQSIAEVAARLGAQITEVDAQRQSDAESLAFRVTEITAAVRGVSAGLRETKFAFADANQAQAGRITQIQSRLDNYGKNNGLGVATIEEVLRTVASRTTGLAAEYFLKVQAGNKLAGIGLSAYEDPSGKGSSEFMVLADKFALVLPGDDTSGGKAPANRIPFGIDKDGMYIHSNVNIKTLGGAPMPVSVLASNASVPSISDVGEFSWAPPTDGLNENAVYRNSTDGNSYILKGGAWQIYLRSGKRGSLTAYATGGAWDDGKARDAILLAGGTDYLVIGDTVTISSAGAKFAETRYWTGWGWGAPGVVIDGNLLVNGTISSQSIASDAIRAEHLDAGSVTARSMHANSITAENGAIADLAVGTLKIAGEAVTVTRGQDFFGVWPAMSLDMKDSWFTMQVLCTASFKANANTDGPRNMHIHLYGMGYDLRQGFVETSAQSGYSYQLTTGSTFGPLPPGFYTVGLEGNSPASTPIQNVSMSIMGVKR